MRDTIAAALTTAIKAQDKRRVPTLRLIMSAIKDRDILNRGSGKEPATNDEISSILAKMIKQREELAKLYEEGNRLGTRRAGTCGNRDHSRLHAEAVERCGDPPSGQAGYR